MALVTIVIHEVTSNMESLLLGSSLNDVLSDKMQTNLLKFLNQSDRSKFMQHLGYSRLSQRILEIGNGRISLASEIVTALTRSDDQIFYSKYTLTSPGYFSCKDQPFVFPKIEYATLDMSQNPFEQGFDNGQYDLIVVINVLYTTSNFRESLANVKKVLRPNSCLLL